jgi:hypothetical protein
MLALKRVCTASHNRRKEMSWGYCQGGVGGGETSFLVMEVTSFSVRESVRRECGVDIVFAWRDIVLREW